MALNVLFSDPVTIPPSPLQHHSILRLMHGCEYLETPAHPLHVSRQCRVLIKEEEMPRNHFIFARQFIHKWIIRGC